MYRKNVAGQFVCFQMLLTATGAVATGLSPAIRRCIDGTFAAGGGTVTEDGATGSYKYAMAQADTNGNDISLVFSAATAMPVCINFVTTAADPTNAATFGITDIDATISSRMATYTQPTGFLTATFPSGTVANTTNITSITGNITGNLSGSVGSVTGLTPATIATGIWQDTTAGDFTTAGSIGKSLGGAFSALGTSVYTSGALANAPSGGLTGAQIATAVWTDTVAGDFTTALSVGKSVMNGVSLGTGLTINGYTGNTPQTGDAFARLGAPAGASVSADIAAVETNAVGIKTQTDKFAFTVANKVDANTIAVNGNAAAANNVAHSMQAIVRGTCSGGTTATAVASAITSPSTLTAAGQLIGRTIIFDADTVTAALQGQASNITNSTTGATPTITFTAMTSAPATGDTFSVV